MDEEAIFPAAASHDNGGATTLIIASTESSATNSSPKHSQTGNLASGDSIAEQKHGSPFTTMSSHVASDNAGFSEAPSTLLTGTFQCQPTVSRTLLKSFDCPPVVSQPERKQSVSSSLLTSSLVCSLDVTQAERKQSFSPPNQLRSPCAESFHENQSQLTFPSEVEYTPSSREDPPEVFAESPSAKSRTFPKTSLDAGCLPSVSIIKNDHESIPITPALVYENSRRSFEEASVASESSLNESFTFPSHSLDIDTLFEASVLEDENESVPITSAPSCGISHLICKGRDSSEATRPSMSKPLALVCASVTGKLEPELLDNESTDSQLNRNTVSGSSNTLVSRRTYISHTRSNKEIISPPEHSHSGSLPSTDNIAEKKHGSPFTAISLHVASDNAEFSEAPSKLLTESFECQPTVSSALLQTSQCPAAVSQSERRQSVSPSLLTSSWVCSPCVSQSERRGSISPSSLTSSLVCPPDVSQSDRKQSISPSLLTRSLVCPPDVSQIERKQSVSTSLLTNSLLCPADVSQSERKQFVSPSLLTSSLVCSPDVSQSDKKQSVSTSLQKNSLAWSSDVSESEGKQPISPSLLTNSLVSSSDISQEERKQTVSPSLLTISFACPPGFSQPERKESVSPSLLASSLVCPPGFSQTERKESVSPSLLTSSLVCPPGFSQTERKESVSPSLLTNSLVCSLNVSDSKGRQSVSPSLLTSLLVCSPDVSQSARERSISPSLLTSSLVYPPHVLQAERKQSVSPSNSPRPCAESLPENQSLFNLSSEVEYTPSSREDPSEVLVESQSAISRSFPPTPLDVGCLSSVSIVENDHESIPITPAVVYDNSRRISEEERVSSEPPPKESFTFSSHSLDMDSLSEVSILEDEKESVPVTSAPSWLTSHLIRKGHESSQATRSSTSEPMVCASVTGAFESEERLDYGYTDSQENRNAISGSSNILVSKPAYISHTRDDKILSSRRKPYLLSSSENKLKHKGRILECSVEEHDLLLHKRGSHLSSLAKWKDNRAGYSVSEKSKWTLNSKECGSDVHMVKRSQSSLPNSQDCTKQHLYSSSKKRGIILLQ